MLLLFTGMYNEKKYLFRSGNTQGSCFAASFGGRCSGTPPECQDCNRVKNCENLLEPRGQPKPLCDCINPFVGTPNAFRYYYKLHNIKTKQQAGSQSSHLYFVGETQSPSVGPVGLASAMFPAMLTVVTSSQLPLHQGCLSLP